ncbi:N-acetyltransferase B complex non catalytic subunit-domain-containing protein [Pavlovales sp. CCMP2436]|nr:N-acetyltransferase B complex non catalytic subunit-domain-containing protein [Pavlovales sp. CCMP2436]
MSEDRRLQAVYDALDVASYKQAIKLCDAALKKGDGQTIMALKAMALLRTGKLSEGRELCLEARRGISAPIDDALVHALTLFYRAAGDLPSVLEVNDEAFKCEPNNVVAGTQLFYAAVRLFDYRRQQAIAMRLQRQFSAETHKRPGEARQFAMWTLTSMLLQARPGGSAGAELAPKLVQLATMMLQKAGGPRDVAELRLAIAIAEAHGEAARTLAQARALEPDEAVAAAAAAAATEVETEGARRVLALLREHAGLLGTLGPESSELEAANTARAGDAAGALAVRERVLLGGAEENWLAISRYLDAALPAPAFAGRAGGKAALAHVLAKQPHARAPLLGRIDVCARLLALASQESPAGTGESPGGADAALAELEEELLAYFKKYADRPCCFEDTRPYFALLVGRESAEALCARADAICAQTEAAGEKGGEIAAGEKGGKNAIDLQRRVTAAQWRAVLGLGGLLGRRARFAVVVKLGVEYGEALPLGDGLEKTELHPADGLLLACSSLICADECPLREIAGMFRPHRTAPAADATVAWTLAAKAAQSTLAAALVLEEGAARSKANFQMKLRLILLYAQLGAAEACRAHFVALGTRKLQLESLLYVVLPVLSSLGNFREAANLTQQTLLWYPEATRETSDTAVLPYKHCNYIQALDFERFRQHIDNSLWRVYCEITAERVRTAGGVRPFVLALVSNLDTAVFESLAPVRGEAELREAVVSSVCTRTAFSIALESCVGMRANCRAALVVAETEMLVGLGGGGGLGDSDGGGLGGEGGAQPLPSSPALALAAIGLHALGAACTMEALAHPRHWGACSPGGEEQPAPAVSEDGVLKDDSALATAAKLLATLQAQLLGWAEAAEAACATLLAALASRPPAGLSWAELCDAPDAADRAKRATGPSAPGAGASAQPPSAETLAACSELALVQLPASSLVAHALVAAVARTLPRVRAKSAPKEVVALATAARAAVRESALRVAESAEALAEALGPLAAGAQAAGGPQLLPLLVLPHTDYALDGTPRALGAGVARAQMEARLRASYVDSCTQLQARLVELGAALRQVR